MLQPDGSSVPRIAATSCLALIVVAGGCASGTHASQGATKGATTGAVAGAVGGLVSALVFGGDPLDRAARGAVYGGTTGAVAGAMSGAERDRADRRRQESELDALRSQIGDDAYQGLVALAECHHDDVLRQAELARASDNPNHALAGLWLQVLVHADRREEATARALFPTLVEQDWNVDDESQAEAEMRGALTDLMDVREQYGLPRVCSQ